MEPKIKHEDESKQNKVVQKENITKNSDDYCIINGQKIEGNACSSIIDNIDGD